MDSSRLAMAAALVRVIESIDESRPVEDTLNAIVDAARTSLPEFAHVSISVKHADGRLETKAGTDPLVWDLDSVQYELGEGPCVDAMGHGPVVLVEHLAREQRWPRYIRTAAAHGVRSQLGLRLFTDRKDIGGLNLYSTEHDQVDQDCVATARLVATHAAIMLGRAEEHQQLTEALQSRKVIGQAIGIVMERYRIDEDRAFQFLVRASSTGNIKVREVASELVASSTQRYRAGR